ncbi:MAG: hypothetical protein AB1345_09515 [Chloroflexota bacterium]
MSTRRLIIWITFIAVFVMAARVSVDTDTWWHLRAGQWVWEHRAILHADTFSYTRAGATWQYPGWLIEVPMYLLYQAFGAGGLNVWTAFMVMLAFFFVWKAMSGGPFLRAFVLIFAVTVSGVYWAARPYMVTFLLSAVYLCLLEDFRWRGADRLWWLPVLTVVWVNSHGGFALGFILWGVYFVRYAWDVVSAWWRSRQGIAPDGVDLGKAVITFRYMFVIGLLMGMAIMLNPYGVEMYMYPFKTVGIGTLREFIQEWQSPDFHQLQVQPFAWMLLLILGVVGVSRHPISFVDFCLVAGLAYMGLLAGRNIATFALAAPIVLSRHLAPIVSGWGERWGLGKQAQIPVRLSRAQRWGNAGLLGILILAGGVKTAYVFLPEINEKHFHETLPVEAVEYIRAERPPGRLFNAYDWGGYLLWALPEYAVFVDGRTDLYGDEVIGEWLQVVRAEDGWEEVLEGWEVRLLLGAPGWPVVRLLEGKGWRLLYADELAVVYSK